MKWPAKPNVFKNCPVPECDGASDCEVFDAFVSDCDATLDNSRQLDDSSVESIYQEVLLRFESNRDEEEALEEQIGSTSSMVTRVSFIRDLCINFDSWMSADDLNISEMYDLGRTKAYDIRRAVNLLMEEHIEGVSYEDFQKTFEEEELMDMTLHRDKCASIRQVVHLYCSR